VANFLTILPLVLRFSSASVVISDDRWTASITHMRAVPHPPPKEGNYKGALFFFKKNSTSRPQLAFFLISLPSFLSDYHVVLLSSVLSSIFSVVFAKKSSNMRIFV
jgi:hypothetical protein